MEVNFIDRIKFDKYNYFFLHSLQQTQLPRSNSAVISSSRFASQSQPTGQMSDSSSFSGW